VGDAVRVLLRHQLCPDHSVAFAANGVVGNLDGELDPGTVAWTERDRGVIERGPRRQLVLSTPISAEKLPFLHPGRRCIQRYFLAPATVIDHLDSALDDPARFDMVDDVGTGSRVLRLGGGNIDQANTDPGVFGFSVRSSRQGRDSRDQDPGYQAKP
jgi:hypothetical protein